VSTCSFGSFIDFCFYYFFSTIKKKYEIKWKTNLSSRNRDPFSESPMSANGALNPGTNSSLIIGVPNSISNQKI